jgi:hypothetical protein
VSTNPKAVQHWRCWRTRRSLYVTTVLAVTSSDEIRAARIAFIGALVGSLVGGLVSAAGVFVTYQNQVNNGQTNAVRLFMQTLRERLGSC